MKRHVGPRTALLIAIVAIIAACKTDSTTDNLPPTLKLDVSSTLEYVVGEGFVNITATAEDPEGGNVTLGVVDKPPRADFQLFDGWGVFRWDPLANDVTPQGEVKQLVFFAEDDFGGRAERVVSLTILPGNGLPRFVSALTISHPIGSGKPVRFPVEVRDDDSQRVAITMPADKAPDGAMFTVTNDFAGQFQWEPSEQQLEFRNHTATFVANDGQNDPVEQKVSILFTKSGDEETQRPDPVEDPADPTGCDYEDLVKHDPLGPQRGTDDYRIEARLAGETAERYDRVVLNWTDQDAYNDLEVEKNGQEMMLEEGVYVTTIPNPLLPSGESKEIYYEICAIDDDDSDDDAVMCGPTSVFHSFIAYSPDNESCIDDAFVNQTFDTAWELTNVIGWEHHRGCGEDAPDYYRVDLQPQQNGDIFFTYPFGKNVDIEMYDADRNLMPIEPSQCSGFVFAYLPNATDQPTTYYFRVIADDLPYQVSPFLFEPVSTCVETDIEPNDTVDDATPIGSTGTPEPEQEICGPMDVDVFEFFAFEGEQITSKITFSHADGDLDANLYAPDPMTGAVDLGGVPARSGLSVNDDELIEYVATNTGNHYLEVFGYGEGNTYVVTNLIEPPMMCTDEDMFAGNHSEMDAEKLMFTTHSGLEICPGQDDWYKFTGFPNEFITITLRATEGNIDDIDMELFLGGVPEETSTRNGDKLTIEVVPFDENEYHLQVESTSEITYELSLGITI